MQPSNTKRSEQSSKKASAPQADALDSEQAKALLDPVDVIRDPLHGDVRLTTLERNIIDTPQFQRLRNINQLAMTYISYPGAVHTRFIHSIGTLKVASTMIETCNKNAHIYRRLASPNDAVPLEIAEYPAVLVRLCALMHDMAHVAFGHTLEKEGRVFQTDEWNDDFRSNQIFGSDSEFVNAFVRTLTNLPIAPAVSDGDARQVLADVREILCCSRKRVTQLAYPFVHDLVGNTICADLIDYVQRDMYFCGLRETIADRFLEYVAVVALDTTPGDNVTHRIPVRIKSEKTFRTIDKQSCRAVLLQYRYNERRTPVQKHDVIAEAIDLVRRRLNVAEKLYFHRTKIAASSMLVTAAHAAGITSADIWNDSDAEVLKELAASSVPRAAILGKKLLDRKIFKPIFRVSFLHDDETPAARRLWEAPHGAYPKYSQPVNRAELITRIERIVGMHVFDDPAAGIGTVAVSCPDKDMNLKAFDMLVMPRPGAPVKRLQDSGYRPTVAEIDAIQSTHKYLWRLEVFIDTAHVALDRANEFSRRLAGAIAAHLRVSNEVDEFANVSEMTLERLEAEVETEWALKRISFTPELRRIDYNSLVQDVSAREGRTPGETVEAFLRAKGYEIAS